MESSHHMVYCAVSASLILALFVVYFRNVACHTSAVAKLRVFVNTSTARSPRLSCDIVVPSQARLDFSSISQGMRRSRPSKMKLN